MSVMRDSSRFVSAFYRYENTRASQRTNDVLIKHREIRVSSNREIFNLSNKQCEFQYTMFRT